MYSLPKPGFDPETMRPVMAVVGGVSMLVGAISGTTALVDPQEQS